MIIKKGIQYKLSTNVLSQQIDGESILLDMVKENYYGLNDVGSCVLKELTDGIEVEALVNKLLNVYNVEKQQLEKGISKLLQQFLDARLIHADIQ